MPSSLLKRALVTSAVVAVGTAVVVTPAQAGGYHEPDNIAHHGASGAAPENTLAAVDLALDQDADVVEVEVQRTSDGELVVIQDLGLARTTNVEEVFPDRSPWLVRDFTLAEIRQLDAGSWFGPEFAGEPVPTLDEVIDEVGYHHGLVIDLANPQLYPGIEADLADQLRSNYRYLIRALAYETLAVHSVNATSAQTFHDALPYVPVGVVYNSRPSDAQLVAVSEWADSVSAQYLSTDQALIDRAHELDLGISVHTVNTADHMADYAAFDVDGIVTAFPALLDDVLD
ncbi:glycerophosphodiester phosphodiesterase [Jiangella asiatica]|uniref:Hydrolase n=1 Tax=Jiangella asiatica TaxID=2530372 RepID=A0A4R5CTN2_9ACTN|nr:glycerophosphodiester phosphodiesterase family protein [Jiangella asiatica]TDE01814.1 hydrolase [Jiangella asiatica]